MVIFHNVNLGYSNGTVIHFLVFLSWSIITFPDLSSQGYAWVRTQLRRAHWCVNTLELPSWSTLTFCTGLRFLLGLAEAGLYPGVVFYMSCWYKRSELGTRVAVFFSSATVAGAFSKCYLVFLTLCRFDLTNNTPLCRWITCGSDIQHGWDRW